MQKENKIRLFFGIPLDKETYNILIRFCSETVLNIRRFRWTKPENLHLTVLFLGDTPMDKLEGIKSETNQIVQAFPAFNLYYKNLSYGPPGQNKSMIWTNYEKNDSFKKLVNSLSESLLDKPVIKDPLPHITLARFKGKPDEKATFNLQLPALPCKQINLWQSELTEMGPNYTVLQSFRLNQS